jgi:hypothetical protein
VALPTKAAIFGLEAGERPKYRHLCHLPDGGYLQNFICLKSENACMGYKSDADTYWHNAEKIFL